MKYNLKIASIAIFVFLNIFSSCRYDEGPVISFRTVQSRLTGDWNIKKFSINGEDFTQLLIDSNSCIMRFRTEIVCFTGDCGALTYQWNYELIDFKNKIEFDMAYILTNFKLGPFRKFNLSTWVIHRLTTKYLWMETNYNDNDYYLKLEK
jgi:hypothetical protein